MDKNSKIRAGVVGMGRGQGFVQLMNQMPEVDLVGICDLNQRSVDWARKKFSLPDHIVSFLDYEEMLDRSDLDMVMVATPIRMHFGQAKIALERNLHVLGEVPAVFSVDEARQLVAACTKSKGSYMMAENANYFKFNLIIREMVEAGLFGELYYAEAEYLHDIRSLNSAWRDDSIYGRNGLIYGTHSLGPVLSWLGSDRVEKISCTGSGRHFKRSDGQPFELEDSCVMMCKTVAGRLIKIRVDLVSPRPSINRYQLQGTTAAYESQYHAKDINKVAFTDGQIEAEEWRDLYDYADKYLPEKYKVAEETAKNAGHDGADYFMLIDYIDALYNGKPVPIDLHKSLDITLPGLISEQSIANGGEWIDVPDSRKGF